MTNFEFRKIIILNEYIVVAEGAVLELIFFFKSSNYPKYV